MFVSKKYYKIKNNPVSIVLSVLTVEINNYYNIIWCTVDFGRFWCIFA